MVCRRAARICRSSTFRASGPRSCSARAFTGVYAWRVAEETRQLAQALAATELVLAREQHLSQLDGLAAAAAHELGTPLGDHHAGDQGTDPSVGDDGQPSVREDLALLREQVDRCRGILSKLTSLDRTRPASSDRLASATSWRSSSSRSAPWASIFESQPGRRPEPVCRRNPGVMFGLANIVDNAVDFAAERVTIEARWTLDGFGWRFGTTAQASRARSCCRAGEPYVTTRSPDGRARTSTAPVSAWDFSSPRR